ncbi:MAG: MFS transporter, partial [Chloroflexi bacterium]|nr:MFS transporter [Chloroflexota bacterium]
GHYRWQGALGIAVMATGTALFSRVTPDTSNAAAVTRIVIIGFGLGITLPVFTIAVQNAVPFSMMGVATSSTQFFRSIGGTVGLAVLGAVMVNRFGSGFETALPQAARDLVPPEQIAALTGNPQALLSAEATEGLRESFAALGPQGAAVGEQVFEALRSALSGAIGTVFLFSLGALLLALVATLFVREIPLEKRRTPGAAAPAGEREAAPAPAPFD